MHLEPSRDFSSFFETGPLSTFGAGPLSTFGEGPLSTFGATSSMAIPCGAVRGSGVGGRWSLGGVSCYGAGTT